MSTDDGEVNSMGEAGCTCDDPDLVPVKDMNLNLPFISGNPYSRFCRCCGRRYFCAKSFWERAAEKFIIPENEKSPVPAEEYGDGEERNFFECPGCGHPHFGFPESCEGDCDAVYDWD